MDRMTALINGIRAEVHLTQSLIRPGANSTGNVSKILTNINRSGPGMALVEQRLSTSTSVNMSFGLTAS